VTGVNGSLDEMTPPRSFAHYVRSWDCGGRWGLKRKN